jgi:hypothetical protein
MATDQGPGRDRQLVDAISGLRQYLATVVNNVRGRDHGGGAV